MQSTPTQIALIFSDLPAAPQLAASLPSGTAKVIIHTHGDVWAQMATALKPHRQLEAIHLISHGSDGAVHLGATTLNSANLRQHTEALQQLSQSLAAGGDWLLYGCNVAASPAGAAFVAQWARITQSAVAASVDATGSGKPGLNWVLEHHCGAVRTAALAPRADSQWVGALAPPTVVTLTLDDTKLKIGDAALLTLVFSEKVRGNSSGTFEAQHVTTPNGTLSNFTTADNITYTGLFTPSAGIEDATNTITVDLTKASDFATDSPGSGTAQSANYEIDTLADPAPTGLSLLTDTGTLGDGITANFAPTIGGSAAPGATVFLYDTDGITQLGSASASSLIGLWAAQSSKLSDGLHTLTAKSVDTAGNLSAASAPFDVRVDTTPPTLTISLSDNLAAIGETITFTFTFSEKVTDFTNLDISYAGVGTLGPLSTVDGMVYSVTLTPTTDLEAGSLWLQVGMLGVDDVAGNSGSGNVKTGSFAVDTKRPTLTSLLLDDSSLLAGETAEVTIKFSEAVTGFTAGDLTVPNGSVSTPTSTDGGVTWTATLTPTANVVFASNAITLAMSDVADLAGNSGTGAPTSANYLVNTQRPTATVKISDTALKIGDTANVTFTFSEAVTGFSNADVTVPNGILSTVSTSNGGVSWSAVFTPTANLEDATNTIDVDMSGVANAAGNAGSGLSSSPNYRIDTQRPTATVQLSESNLKIGDTATVTITFSEAVTGFTNADLNAFSGSVTALSSGDGGVTWTAKFTPSANVEAAANAIQVDLTGLVDLSGNTGIGVSASANYQVDTKRPTATVQLSDTNLKIGETATITIAFSEAVTGFTNADLTVPNGTLTSVSSSDGGTTWSATFTPSTNHESSTNVITLDPSGVTDLSGNSGSGTVDSLNYAIDTQTPAAPSAPDLVAGSDTGTSSTDNFTADSTPTLIGTSEANTTVAIFHGATQVGSGTATGGGKWSITTSTLPDGAYSLTAKATDSAGNTSSTSSSLQITVAATPPVINPAGSSVVDNATNVSIAADLVLGFSVALDGLNPTDVVLKDVVTGTPVPATVSLNGQGKLVIAPTTDLAYDTDYFVNWGPAALVDPAGNQAAALTGSTGFNFRTEAAPVVESPPPPPPVVDGATVITTTDGSGNTTTTIPPVPPLPPGSSGDGIADVPLVQEGGQTVLTAGLPPGTGISSSSLGGPNSSPEQQSTTALDRLGLDADTRSEMLSELGDFLADATGPTTVRALTLTAATDGSFIPGQPITITGGSTSNEVLVIDLRKMPSGTVLKLDGVAFALVIGAVRIIGGEGENVAVGDGSGQFMVLGADNDILRGGAGNDLVASRSGNDQLFGDAGDDTLIGGLGSDTLEGGTGNDILQGGASDAGTLQVSLSAAGQISTRYTAADTALSEFTTLSWTGSVGSTDARVAHGNLDPRAAADASLLVRALADRLPTLGELNALAGSYTDSKVLAQSAYGMWLQLNPSMVNATPVVRMQALLAEFGGATWGTSGNAQAALAWMSASNQTWPDAMLAAARLSQGLYAQASGSLPLAHPFTVSEAGIGADPSGNDVLRGGDGHDRLIGGRGNDTLDGGFGLDVAVFIETPDAYLLRATAGGLGVPTTLQVARRDGTEVDTLINVEYLQFGLQVYNWTTPFAQTGTANVPVTLTAMSDTAVQLSGILLG